jgi:pimeloyl-ACP methyl ester carboxylesterase
MKKHIRSFLYASVFVSLCLPTEAADAPAFRTEEVVFASHGVQLSGTLAIPTNQDVRAAVVFIHGSGKQTRSMAWAEKFAEAGIAALVYDKRGVGKSGGEFEDNRNVSEANLSLLADDAVAALQTMMRREALAGVPAGFTGISQAGWIAPLAARRSPRAKFLVLWSGPVCKVSEEDIFSKYTRDANEMVVPTYRQALDARTEKYIWPAFMGADTDPATSLKELSIPGLWIFSDNDGSIPVDLSIERLKGLIERGRKYDYVLFSGLGHNNMEGTFHVATHWIRQQGNRPSAGD